MRTRLTIGEFSHITHLSIRTLRRYHEQDLLVPAEVDPFSGYRYYSPEQVRPALTIRRFRELDLPLADLRRYLHAMSPAADGEGLDVGQEVVAAHLRRLEDRLGRTQRAVEALRELLDPAVERPVALEVLPAQRVLAVTLDVPPGSDLTWYDAAMRDLDAAVDRRPVLPPGGRYAHELFSEGSGRATVYLPTATAPPSATALPAGAALPSGGPSTVRELDLPERRAAVATHVGSHEDLDLTYGAVGSFAARHDLRPQELVEEIYLVGPRDTDHPDRWRTLVAWLIETPN
ncbi:MerR family transcriptional regulator [Kribbella sp. NPDC048928]|uniref:MerR family transcriptional regulator n=1 Tax=Kribbella sp. NPDC048928 TaxID=3364111 RepID=UPI0037118B50